MANIHVPDSATGEAVYSVCMEPCQHSFCPTCSNQAWGKELKEKKITCPECREISPKNKPPSTNPLLETEEAPKWTNAAQTLCQKHRRTLSHSCGDDQPHHHSVCQDSWDDVSQTAATPRNQLARTENTETGGPLSGWEKSFPESNPTGSTIAEPSDIKMDFSEKGELPDGNEEDNKEKLLLIEHWVDFNLEENKEKDAHSNSRVQNSITWILLILFIIQIVGLVTTIFVFTKAKPSLPAAATVTSCCPRGWIMNQGNCYHVVEKEGSWEEGRMDCSSLGATLAVINNLEKLNVAVYDKGPLNHWIGFFRDTEDSLRWPNGTVFNNAFEVGGDEQCAYLSNGAVNSTSCAVKKKSLCSQKVERGGKNNRCWET